MINIKGFFGKKKKNNQETELVKGENEKRVVIQPPPAPSTSPSSSKKNKSSSKKEKPYTIDLNGVGEIGGKAYNNVIGVLSDNANAEITGELSPTIYCVSDFQGLLKVDRKWIQMSDIPEEYLTTHFQTILSILNFLRRRDLVHYILVEKPDQIIEHNLDNLSIPDTTITTTVDAGNDDDNNNKDTPSYNNNVPVITTTDTTTLIEIPKNYVSLLEDDIKNEQKTNIQLSVSTQSTLSPTLSPRSESSQFDGIVEELSSSGGLNAANNNNNNNAMLTAQSSNNISAFSYSIMYPGKKKRIDATRVFTSPGEYFKYPEEYPLALEKLLNEGNPKEQFKNLDFSARGGFGCVFLAKNKNPHSIYDKQMVALKKMPVKNYRHKRMNLSEIGFMKYLNHANIVKFLCSYQKSDEELWLIMEYLSSGTLKNAVSNFKFDDKKIAYVCREVLKGIEYLHSLNLAHRDLKTANIMVSDKAEIKLIDFGLCIDFNIEKEEINMLGSPSYISPEMINGIPHSLSTDIWSFGICTIEMLLGKLPYCESRLKPMILVGSGNFKIENIPSYSTWSNEIKDFLSKCLDYDITKRATATQLLQHPFLLNACTVKEFKNILPALSMSSTLSNMF